MTRREALASLSAVLLAVMFKAVEFVALPVTHRPDLLMVLAVSVGWTCGFWTSVPSGFILGILEDLFTGRAPGSRAISLCVASTVTTTMRRFVNPESVVSKAMAALVSTVLADAACFGAMRAAGVEIGLTYAARAILPASVAWSVILILPVDAVARRFAAFLGRFWPAREDKEREVPA